MYKSKVIEIMESFSTEEMNRFVYFVKASYFNPRTSLIPLVEIIKKNHPNFKDDWLEKTTLYESLFPGELYKYSRLGEMFSRLLDVALDFLSQIEWEREPSARHILAGYQCYMRGLNNLAREVLVKSVQLAEASPYRDGEYFYAQFLCAMLESLLEKGDVHNTEKSTEVNKPLDIWYIHWKLHLASSAFSQAKLSDGVPDTPLITAILESLKEHPYLEVPLVGLYYYGLVMNVDSSYARQYYDKFWKLFKHHSQKLPVSDRVALHSKAINFCISQYDLGERIYLAKAFSLDKYAESEGFLIDGSTLSDSTFKSIVTQALECKELSWTRNFIKKYSPKLSEETRESTKNLCLAELECCRGNFRAMEKRLLTIKKIDDFDFLKTQTLSLRMHFENKEWEKVEQFTSHLKRFFRRKNTVSHEYAGKVRSFTKLVESIVKVFQSERSDFKQVLIEIEKEAVNVAFINKEWLLGQIKKLKKVSRVALPINEADTNKISQ